MQKLTLFAAALMVVGFAATSAEAQQTKPIKINASIGRPENFGDIKPTQGISDLDRKTLVESNFLNIFEIEAGKLAMRKGNSVWTRHYGQDMVREHTMAQNELKTLAREHGVNLPQELPANMKADLAKLQKRSGRSFDSTYRSLMVRGHGSAKVLMAREIKFGNDTSVINYATKMMGSIDHHQDMAIKRMTMYTNPRMYAVRL